MSDLVRRDRRRLWAGDRQQTSRRPISTRIRLAVIATHPIQYQAPIWRALAAMPLLDVHVYYGSDYSVRGQFDPGFGVEVTWDVPLLAGYDYTVLRPAQGNLQINSMFSMHARNLRGHLARFRPDYALVTAYLPVFWLEAIAILRMMRVPILLRAEATDVALARHALKRNLRRAALSLLYGNIACFLAIGSHARAHYLAHGVSPSRIGWSPYCIDTDLFERQVEQYVPQRADIRHSLGLCAEQVVLIFAGKLIPKKSPLTIAEALALLPEALRARLALLVVGDGELRAPMERACRDILGERAVFCGFANQSQMGRYYAAADCLVLPSIAGETWGLVVNEALQFGLPALVSDRVGCHPDLIIDGETGFVFPASDAQGLQARIAEICALLGSGRDQMQDACRSRVAHYSMAEAARGVRDALLSLQIRT